MASSVATMMKYGYFIGSDGKAAACRRTKIVWDPTAGKWRLVKGINDGYYWNGERWCRM